MIVEECPLKGEVELELRDVGSFTDYDRFFATHGLVIYVCSSYGDGEPPDSALNLQSWVDSQCGEEGNAETLSHLEYFLCGLGDRNYTSYQGYPINLAKQWAKLGAKLLYERGECDNSQVFSFRRGAEVVLSVGFF